MGQLRILPTSEARSALMRRIPGKNTKIELLVRSMTHRLGYRFRIHYKRLPGTPDLAFPSRKKVIHVHGCFWHQHDCPLGRKRPHSNEDYWLPKLARNKLRDVEHQVQLTALGWKALVIWECETHDLEKLSARIVSFLGPSGASENCHRS